MKDKQKLFSFLSILSLVLASALFFGALIFGLSSVGVIDLSRIFSRDDPGNEIIPGDGGRFAEALHDGQSTDEVLLVAEIPLSQLTSLLRNNLPEETYYISNSFTYYSDGVSYSGSNRIWKDGEKYRVETYQGTTLEQTVICDSSRISIKEGQSGSIFFKINEQFNLESYASMPHPRDFLYSWDISDLNITLLRTESENLYQVSYRYPALNQTELLYISLEYGIVVRAETYVNMELVYSLTTDQITNSLEEFDIQALFES